jgi:hypothetical protein
MHFQTLDVPPFHKEEPIVADIICICTNKVCGLALLVAAAGVGLKETTL